MIKCPRPMCPQTKSLVCSVPWTMRPLDDGSLRQHVPDRCVSTLDRMEVLVVTSQFGFDSTHCISVMYIQYTGFASTALVLTYPDVRSVCLKRSGHVGLGCVDQWTHCPRDGTSGTYGLETPRSGTK
jgi:hypothetical protein